MLCIWRYINEVHLRFDPHLNIHLEIHIEHAFKFNPRITILWPLYRLPFSQECWSAFRCWRTCRCCAGRTSSGGCAWSPTSSSSSSQYCGTDFPPPSLSPIGNPAVTRPRGAERRHVAFPAFLRPEIRRRPRPSFENENVLQTPCFSASFKLSALTFLSDLEFRGGNIIDRYWLWINYANYIEVILIIGDRPFRLAAIYFHLFIFFIFISSIALIKVGLFNCPTVSVVDVQDFLFSRSLITFTPMLKSYLRSYFIIQFPRIILNPSHLLWPSKHN